MIANEIDLLALLNIYGIAILAPLAIIEGPIVTVIAAWLASLGLLNLWEVLICVILADLVGDSLMYLAGRFGLDWIPARWRMGLRLNRRRLVRLARMFQTDGIKILIIGKLTHAAGFAVLLAAGAARMPFLTFLTANFFATLPKCLALAAIGYFAGAAYGQISSGIYWLSLAAIAVLILAALLRHRLVVWYQR